LAGLRLLEAGFFVGLLFIGLLYDPALEKQRAIHVSRRARARYVQAGLEAGGSALIKIFQGAGFQELVKLVSAAPGKFAKVKL